MVMVFDTRLGLVGLVLLGLGVGGCGQVTEPRGGEGALVDGSAEGKLGDVLDSALQLDQRIDATSLPLVVETTL